jgi:tRNA threonylcarbamoyladenosine biosynthesis protein TsaB
VDQHGSLAPDSLVLAVESATSRLSVAVLRDGDIAATRSPEDPGQHAEQILPLIDAVLEDASISIGDLTAFAVSIGPGSFTSLRVGLATVKGLAFGSGRPVVAVPTLEALAFGALRADDADPIVTLLDARRGELYAAGFEPDGSGVRRVLVDGLFSPAELATKLPPTCRLVGEGALLFGEELRKLAGPGVRLPDPADAGEVGPPRASSVARLAAGRLRRNEVADADLAPRYVRRAEAEATRTAQAAEDPV